MRYYLSISSYFGKIDSAVYFFTLGFFLPISLFVYRGFCLLQQKAFLLKYQLLFFVGNQITEPLLFCYSTALLLFFFLSKKQKPFFLKLFRKCNLILTVYSIICNFHIYFCKNQIKCLFFIFLYYALYLFCLYENSFFEIFFLGFRLGIFSYISFIRFFDTESKTLNSFYIENFFYFSFFNTFLPNYVISKSIENQVGITILNTIHALLFAFLYKKNSNVHSTIQKCETNCDNAFIFLQKEKKEVPFFLQELFWEKKEIFSFNHKERKTCFHFTVYEIFGSVTKNCTNFYEKLINL